MHRSLQTAFALILPLAACAAFASSALAIDRVGSGFADSVRAVTPRAGADSTWKPLRFTPSPLARCEGFMLVEASWAYAWVEADDWLDQNVFTNSLGYLRNVTPRDAVGAALDAHWMNGHVAQGASVRWRRWVGRHASVETALGWARNGADGVHGPFARVSFAPVPEVQLHAGVLGYRTQQGFVLYETLEGRPANERVLRVFTGVGFTGAPAAVGWGTQALLLALAAGVALSLGS